MLSQEEFCPPLDSSLIAAFLHEIQQDLDGSPISPSQEQIDELRDTLKELASQADESQQSESSDFQFTSENIDSASSWTTPDDQYKQMRLPFDSPLGFLQAALPEVPVVRLEEALKDFDVDSTDMWDIVAMILTQEAIREMEERGLGEEEEMEILEWTKVQKKKVMPKKNQVRPTKIVLGDVRRQHQVVNKQQGRDTRPSPDLWIQVSSISSQAATLLPSTPASFFQSYFHSPNHKTSYDALRAALLSISHSKPSENATDDEDVDSTVLFNLLDVVLAENEDADVEERDRIIADCELAVRVTLGQGDAALDLVHLLRDLDSNDSLGLRHHKPRTASTLLDPIPTRGVQLPSQPSPIPPPPKQKPPLGGQSGKKKKGPSQWQTVPARKPPPKGPHPLAAHIPTYARDVNGMKSKRATGSGTQNIAANYEMRMRMGESMRRRQELLREASRMWQKGNKQTRGGEVAFYFAERVSRWAWLGLWVAISSMTVLTFDIIWGLG